jgi:RNA polymerase sigma factor (sigma-70 family)
MPEGADAGFAEVYELYADRVYRFCLASLRDPAAAEDVAADVFVSALRAWRRRPVPEPGVRPWLLRIARNAIIDRGRRANRWSAIWTRLVRSSDAEENVEELSDRRDALSAAVAALATLSERDRQLVALRVAAGLSHAEIGLILGMKPSAAKVACQRALLRLRGRLVEGPTS